jgi:hypothetical protein
MDKEGERAAFMVPAKITSRHRPRGKALGHRLYVTFAVIFPEERRGPDPQLRRTLLFGSSNQLAAFTSCVHPSRTNRGS